MSVQRSLAIGIAVAVLLVPAMIAAPRASAQGGLRGYEPAFYEGETVIVNIIELRQVAPDRSQADFFEVVYPIGWETMGVGTPQCNPCDHPGDGPSFDDYHDHVLDSVPSSPRHGAYSPLWRVLLVLPAYNGEPAHDAAVSTAYATGLKADSLAKIGALLSMTLDDGSPVAVLVNIHFYFLCAVVSPNAAG